jgi:hypothetical protein
MHVDIMNIANAQRQHPEFGSAAAAQWATAAQGAAAAQVGLACGLIIA